MRRMQLLELEDQTWFPAFLRNAMTDYLQRAIEVGDPYAPISAPLAQALRRMKVENVIDLCSGGGGPWSRLQERLTQAGCAVQVCLTDRYPNLPAFQQAQAVSACALRFYEQPVDATQVPQELTGFRTLFSSLHHFSPEQARALLRDAVEKRQGIGAFEATQRRLLPILLMLLTPLFVWLLTPSIRPFRPSRLFWTYLVPIIPLAVMFDGIVSCLRTYSPAELQDLTAGIGEGTYHWEIGEVKGDKAPIPVTYLIGTPISH